MAMTLEEAVKNAKGYEEQYEREKMLYEMALQNGSNPSRHFHLMKEAEKMLKYYYGEDVVHGIYKDGKWVETSREHIDGEIAKMGGKAQRLQKRSNLGERFKERTFANFKKERDPEAYQACVAYANRTDLFTNEKNSLMIMGNPGTGKTHLAASIANDFVSKEIPTLFGTLVDHLEHIKEEFEHGGTNEYLGRMKSVMVLVIDDLGQEKPTEWMRQTLYQVINHRYEHKLPIVITTNFTADELASYLGHSVFSRLYEMSNGVETKSNDYRMEHH